MSSIGSVITSEVWPVFGQTSQKDLRLGCWTYATDARDRTPAFILDRLSSSTENSVKSPQDLTRRNKKICRMPISLLQIATIKRVEKSPQSSGAFLYLNVCFQYFGRNSTFINILQFWSQLTSMK